VCSREGGRDVDQGEEGAVGIGREGVVEERMEKVWSHERGKQGRGRVGGGLEREW